MIGRGLPVEAHKRSDSSICAIFRQESCCLFPRRQALKIDMTGKASEKNGPGGPVWNLSAVHIGYECRRVENGASPIGYENGCFKLMREVEWIIEGIFDRPRFPTA